MGNGKCGLFDVIDSKIVGVVNAGQIEGRAAVHDRLTLVEQHTNPHRFEIGDHADGVAIAEHTP